MPTVVFQLGQVTRVGFAGESTSITFPSVVGRAPGGVVLVGDDALAMGSSATLTVC
jgi:hypothetical protein